MATPSAAFLVLALVLAVVVGPQTRPWTWGPAMLALGGAGIMAAIGMVKGRRLVADFEMVLLGAAVTGWFVWRAIASPVVDLGQSDLMLLGAAAMAFVAIRGIEGSPGAEKLLLGGMVILLIANLVVVAIQVGDSSYHPLFRGRSAEFPSGFYAHYNEAANYLIASSFIVGAAALFGGHPLLIRIALVIVAIGGLIAVYFTHSRGGILAAAVGTGVFAGLALVRAKRSGSRWFGPSLIAIPIIAATAGLFLYYGWKSSQEIRGGADISQIFDNDHRLYYLGIAMSCISEHPWIGGGSGSFSWENFKYFNPDVQGVAILRKAEMVHNEFVQAATDYGLIGVGLLVGFLGALGIVTVIRLLFGNETGEKREAIHAWRIGGTAALVGMSVQSCFSFVFHLMPGVILLGICLGMMSSPSLRPIAPVRRILTTSVLMVAVFGFSLLLIPYGWKGIQVTTMLWKSYIAKGETTPDHEAKAFAIHEALKIWPTYTLLLERGFALQLAAISAPKPEFEGIANMAVSAYKESERRNPNNPEAPINLANLLSQLGRDREAEDAYGRAVEAQGGMEIAFQGHLSFANHLFAKGIRQFEISNPEVSLASLEIAAQQIELAASAMGGHSGNLGTSRVAIHESLGAAREANGDYKGAMASFDFASALHQGSRANYRAGLLIGKIASKDWAERRPGLALWGFNEAKRRIEMTGELPDGVTPEQRVGYLGYLAKTIEYLVGAKVSPEPPGTK